MPRFIIRCSTRRAYSLILEAHDQEDAHSYYENAEGLQYMFRSGDEDDWTFHEIEEIPDSTSGRDTDVDLSGRGLLKLVIENTLPKDRRRFESAPKNTEKIATIKKKLEDAEIRHRLEKAGLEQEITRVKKYTAQLEADNVDYNARQMRQERFEE